MWRACADQYNIYVDNSPKNFAKNVDKTSFATKKVIFWPKFLLKITASDKKAKKTIVDMWITPPVIVKNCGKNHNI